MKISILAAGILALASTTSAGAATADLGGYTLSYDENALGNITSNFTSGGNSVGFSWNLPSDIIAVSAPGVGSGPVIRTLPSFTITANPGYTLSGPLTGFLGNLVYTEYGPSATTSATATANASVNGGPSFVVGGALDKFETVDDQDVSSGYYSISTTIPAGGSFASFSVQNFELVLQAYGNAFASIVAQPQNELKVSFLAVPVPEPETYAMMLAGIGLIAAIARRRAKQGA